MRGKGAKESVFEVHYCVVRWRLQFHWIQLRQRLTRQVVSKTISPCSQMAMSASVWG